VAYICALSQAWAKVSTGRSVNSSHSTAWPLVGTGLSQTRTTVSGETVRRWLHEGGWEWKRAKLRASVALFLAGELDINLLPKVGYQWMPKGKQVEVLTPGPNEKRYWAGAVDIATGRITQGVWDRKQTGLFLELLDRPPPAPLFTQLTVVVDNAKRQKARKVQQWLTAHPRLKVLSLPTYCPDANPIERAFGDVHDKCTRNHTRKRLWSLVQDVKQYLQINGPWRYALSELY
jgi:DDE superfamily endonuclease